MTLALGPAAATSSPIAASCLFKNIEYGIAQLRRAGGVVSLMGGVGKVPKHVTTAVCFFEPHNEEIPLFRRQVVQASRALLLN